MTLNYICYGRIWLCFTLRKRSILLFNLIFLILFLFSFVSNFWTNFKICFVNNVFKVFSFQTLVKPIFDLTYCATKDWLHLWDLSPFGTDLGLHFYDELVFLSCPVTANDGWVEDVVPSFTALSSKSAFEKARNYHPVLSTKLGDLLLKKLVFFWCPLRAGLANGDLTVFFGFFVWWIRCGFTTFFFKLFELKISFKTSDLSFLRHKSTKSVPRSITINCN